MHPESHLDTKKIENLTIHNFQNLIDYVRTHSAFYRRTLPKNCPVTSLKSISGIPFTKKEDLASFSSEFLCVPAEKITEISTTSGSTGKPLIVKMTEHDIQRLGKSEFLCFTGAGVLASDTFLLAVTLDKCFIAGLAYYLGLREIGAGIVRVGPTQPEMLLKMAIETGATGMVGVPSYFIRVMEYALQSGFPVNELLINKLVMIGEPIRNADLTLNNIGKRLFELWPNCGLYSTFGMTELQGAFCECTAMCGNHIHPEQFYVEILDDNGNVLPPETPGELTVTTFGIEGMPLIRYRTGDVTYLINKPCACGLLTPRIGPIVGRKSQKLKIKGTTLYPGAILNAMDEMDFILDYAVIITGNLDLSDEVEIRYCLNKNSIARTSSPAVPLNPEEEKRHLNIITEKLKSNLKITPRCIPDTAEAIDALKSSVSHRKKTRIIDRRKK